MATDISKSGNSVKVTVTGQQPICYVGGTIKYSFDSAGVNLNMTFGTAGYITVPIANLTVGGASQANAAAAYTALGTLL